MTTISKPDKTCGFHYGYIIALVCFITVMMGWGIFYLYGIFFNPLTEEFGWSRATTSGASSVCILVAGFLGIAAGRLSDRLGPQKVITVCALILVLGYFLMSFIQNAWQFYAIYGLVISAGLCGMWAPPVSTVARWFAGQRGLITGIVGGGISFGTLALAPAIAQLISVYGWRKSYLIIGAVILVVMLTASRFLKQNPPVESAATISAAEKGKKAGDGRQGGLLKKAVRTPQFWTLCLIYVCFGLTYLIIMIHIVPEATGLGITPVSASVILSIMGISGLAGRIIIGIVTDRLRVKTSAIISLSLLTASFLWLQGADNLWKLCVFALLFGFGYGGLSCLQSLFAVELFGLATVGVITAIFSFSFNVGGAVGPVLAGYIFDVSGSYRWAFLICLWLIAAALILSFSLKPPKKS